MAPLVSDISITVREGLAVTFHGLAPERVAALRAVAGTAAAVAVSQLSVARGQDITLLGTVASLRGLALSLIPSPLADFSPKLLTLLDNYLRSDYKITCGDVVLDLGKRTHVMGILNVTPDSFSDGGRHFDLGAAVARAKEMAAQGADIIDVGGESTRPGSDPITEDEEIRRTVPVIERLVKEIPTPVSIDTYKAAVADRALAAGASIVNDISGLRFSPDMAQVVAASGAALVIMHIKGTPRNMQQNPAYDDVVREVAEYLGEGIALAERAGVDRDRILIDPGIGFGKTLEHNLELLKRLDEFRRLGRPVVIGTSRKRFIGTVLDQPVPDQRIEGTAATIALAIGRGAKVVRVHDVAAMVRVARMADAVVKHVPASR